MAKTRRDLTSDGVTVIYDVDFDLGYMRREYVYVYLDGDDYTTQLTYTWVNSTQIQLAAPLAIDTEFHIRRVVPRDELVNDYVDGAILYERNLDDSYSQSLMILEETDDGYSDAYGDLSELIQANTDQIDINTANIQANNDSINSNDSDIAALNSQQITMGQQLTVRINTNAEDIYDLQSGDVNVPVSVLDVAALRLKEPQYDGQSIDLLGHTIKGVGGGTIYHDVDDTTTADNNGTVFVTPLGARWKRRLSGFVEPEMFGAIQGGVVDCAPSIRDAIAYAHTDLDARCVSIGAGYYLCDSGLGQITKAISIIGRGRRQSICYFTENAIGQMLELYRLGFRGETTEFPQSGDTAYLNKDDIHSGFVMKGINFTGNRSVNQDCIVMTGGCDNLTVEDVDISYFNGIGMWLGNQYDGIRGSVRESNFNKVTFRNCGKVDGTPSILIQRTVSPNLLSADAVNMTVFNQFEVIFSYGKGIHIHAVRDTDAPPIYGLQFTNLIMHGRAGGAANNGSLFEVEGYVANLKVEGDITYSRSEDYAVTLKAALDGGRLISGVFNLSMPVTTNGVNIDDVQSCSVNLRSARAYKTLVKIPDTNFGTIEVNTTTNTHKITGDNSVTLSGVTPVNIDYTSVAGFASEFFIEGDILCYLGGYEGLAQYDAGTFQCTFTPTSVSATGFFQPELNVLNKIHIDKSRETAIAGNWGNVIRGRVRNGDVSLSNAILQRDQRINFLNGATTAGNRTYLISFSGSETFLGVNNSLNADTPLLSFAAGEFAPKTRARADFQTKAEFDDSTYGFLRLGDYRLWVDAAGGLRMKSGIPTTDVDGVLIGSQT